VHAIQILIVASACMLSAFLYVITGELISIEFHMRDICPIMRILVSTFIEAKHFLNKVRREK